MKIFKVGSFYPYAIVAAESHEQAIEVAKADPTLLGSEGIGNRALDGSEWVVEELDASTPGILDANWG